MSTASIKKPMIITSDKSAKIIADVLDSVEKKSESKPSRVSVSEVRGKSILSFLKGIK